MAHDESLSYALIRKKTTLFGSDPACSITLHSTFVSYIFNTNASTIYHYDLFFSHFICLLFGIYFSFVASQHISPAFSIVVLSRQSIVTFIHINITGKYLLHTTKSTTMPDLSWSTTPASNSFSSSLSLLQSLRWLKHFHELHECIIAIIIMIIREACIRICLISYQIPLALHFFLRPTTNYHLRLEKLQL